MKSTKEIKERIIAAGYDAVEQLIKVAKEDIIKPNADDELAADKLKNAAATKKLAIFDAFEILSRIESEKESLETTNSGPKKIDSIQGFAERRSK
jgi:DNA-binding ferritin-like protein|tara:strand:- start:1166 stop:1450 length:285 start_codon:yes stop_codon:yes gene_type:complete